MLFRILSLSLFLALAAMVSPACIFAQEAGTQAASFPPVPDSSVARYTAYKTTEAIQVDGQLTEADWAAAPRSPKFVDLISGRQSRYNTQAAVMWDDKNLYVGYWIEEPFLQASFTLRDSPIYQDNDVELFIAGKDAYYEFEVNSFNTIYEGLFVWQDNFVTSGFSKIPDLDQTNPATKFQMFNGVGLTNHPRGKRWAYLHWDFPGIKHAVHLDGTVNDDSDRDRGWTVELALPWEGMKLIHLNSDRKLPPEDGDVWRIDFSRFNKLKEPLPAEDSGGWAWSSHGVWDSHVPEVFPYVTFSNAPVSQQASAPPASK